MLKTQHTIAIHKRARGAVRFQRIPRSVLVALLIVAILTACEPVKDSTKPTPTPTATPNPLQRVPDALTAPRTPKAPTTVPAPTPATPASTLSATTTVPNAPAAPRLRLSSDSVLLVEWTPPRDGGSPVTHYEVAIQANDDLERVTVVKGDNNTLLIDVRPSTSYTVSVYAANTLGTSAPSSPTTITTTGMSLPELPPIENKTGRVGDSIDLTLPESVGGDGSLAYWVNRLPAGLSFDPNERRVTGTLTAEQSVSITYSVSDSDDSTHWRTFMWTVRRATGRPPGNRPPAVSMVHESLAVPGGVPVLLNARTHDPDGDELTYEWTVTPMIGELVQAFPRNPTWFPPAAVETAQVVTVTLTVSDAHGGAASADTQITVLPAVADTPAPPDGLMERLNFAIEQMLAGPSQQDPSMTVGERNPWLRQAWDYATKVGDYAALDYDFEIDFGGEIPIVHLECYPVDLGELVPCAPSGLTMPEFLLEDRHIVGDLSHIFRTTMAHELAHVFTMSSLVSPDSGQRPRPDLYAMAMLALFKQHSDPATYGCDGRELLADALQVAVYPATWGGYWFDCMGQHHPLEEEEDAHAIVQSLLDGGYPAWFMEEYGLPSGGFALRRLWTDVIALEELDPFPKQLLVWQLQDAFGVGYCSPELTADSAYRGANLPNPWASTDTDEAGCE